MLEKKYPISVSMSPGILISNGQKYAVAGEWIPIPMEVGMHNLHEYVRYEPAKVESPLKKFSVKSSNGKTKYLVEVWPAKITCNCSGFRWRQKCKHTAAIKKYLKK